MATTPSVRIGIYGSEVSSAARARGVGLWSAGYQGTLTAAGAVPVFLKIGAGNERWDEVLQDVDGVVFSGSFAHSPHKFTEEGLCLWCRDKRLPLLAIDQGLLTLNQAFGGLNHQELSKELPEALQHRHPPEEGVRHAILVEPDSLVASIYGEGEIVVNSEHRQAVQKVAAGFRIGARALDGVIEAIEYQRDDWFAIGVQWQPASATASGLDIQLFRSLVDHCAARLSKTESPRLAIAG